MKIRKSTFKNGQAWLSIESHGGEYVGTWHIVNPIIVEDLKKMDLDQCELKLEESTNE